MAGIRKKGKKKIGFWLNEAERNLLKEIADREGLTQTDALRKLLIEASKREGVMK